MFKSFLDKIGERRNREQLYAFVVEEMAGGQIRSGLWGQALAEAGGNEEQAKANYISLRVQALIDEEHLAELAEQARLERAEQIRQDQLDLEKKRRQAAANKRFWFFWLPLSVMVFSFAAWIYIEPDIDWYFWVAVGSGAIAALNAGLKFWLSSLMLVSGALGAYFGTVAFVQANLDPINIFYCLLSLTVSAWNYFRLKDLYRED